MEFLDIYNPDGTPTGKTKRRDEVHRDGDWHKTVHAWILNSTGELLIQQRSSTKETSPGKWDVSIAGHIPAGTESMATLIREAFEELGLGLEGGDGIEYLFTVRSQSKERSGTLVNNEIQDVFLIRKDVDSTLLKLQESEVSAVRWVTPEELTKHIGDVDNSFVVHRQEYEGLLDVLKNRGIL